MGLTDVAIGRYVENGFHAIRYVGTQLVLPILVFFAPDHYNGVYVESGLKRLFGGGPGVLL